MQACNDLIYITIRSLQAYTSKISHDVYVEVTTCICFIWTCQLQVSILVARMQLYLCRVLVSCLTRFSIAINLGCILHDGKQGFHNRYDHVHTGSKVISQPLN